MAAELKKGPLLGQRHLQTFLLFMAITVNYYAKLNTSVAVVAMTNAAKTNPNFPEYNWTEMEKSLIISSFYWGYFLTQFPGGYMCRRFGAKIIMLTSTLGSAVLALAIPIGVECLGWRAYCVIRIGQGLFQGLLFPCVYAHLAAWCPFGERNRLGALSGIGVDCGTVLAMFGSGMIASSAIGWPGISYLASTMGIIWSILWIIFSANTPAESKFISPVEKAYIEGCQNETKEKEAAIEPSAMRRIPIPWRAIFTSAPFMFSLITVSCQSWGFYTLQAEIPAYMNSVLGMDMKKNATFSALPYLAMLSMSFVCLISSDVLINNNILTLKALRKLFTSIALLLPAIGLTTLCFLGKEQATLVIVLLIVCVGCNAATTIGCSLNIIDLSPNHTSILMGISNTTATFIPILTPLYIGSILKDQTNHTQWQIIFATAAIFLAIGNIVFLIFASTDTQPWDDRNFLLQRQNLKEKEKEKESKKDIRNFKEIF